MQKLRPKRGGSGIRPSPLTTTYDEVVITLSDAQIREQYGDLIEEALHHFATDTTYLVDMMDTARNLMGRRVAMDAAKQRRRAAKEAAKAQDPCDEIVTEVEPAPRLTTSGRTPEVTDPSEGEAGSGAYQRRATHCRRGHDLTVPGNRYVSNGIKTQCRICREASPARQTSARERGRTARTNITPSTPTQQADPTSTD